MVYNFCIFLLLLPHQLTHLHLMILKMQGRWVKQEIFNQSLSLLQFLQVQLLILYEVLLQHIIFE